MKSRGIQFWTLLILSLIISLLLLSQIYLSHAIIREQHLVIDSKEAAGQGPYYRQAWQKLAVSIWKAGAQDPAMFDLLKTERIGIHQGPPPGTPNNETGTNAAPSPAPPAAPKAGTPNPPTP
jgi:hypothetical protein